MGKKKGKDKAPEVEPPPLSEGSLEVKMWLTEAKLDKAAVTFDLAGFNSLRKVADATPEDLHTLAEECKKAKTLKKAAQVKKLNKHRDALLVRRARPPCPTRRCAHQANGPCSH